MVTGTITYKGQPVNGAMLELHPTSAGQGTYPIIVSQEGNFSAADVPAGEYKVVLQGSAAAPSVSGAQYATKATIPFPNKYKDEKTTDLTCTITAGRQTTLNLELKD